MKYRNSGNANPCSTQLISGQSICFNNSELHIIRNYGCGHATCSFVSDGRAAKSPLRNGGCCRETTRAMFSVSRIPRACRFHCSITVIYSRERNVLFNDTLNTFYLRLYGVRHMVKDHSDSEKGNPLPPHRLLLSINSKGSFICTIPQTG